MEYIKDDFLGIADSKRLSRRGIELFSFACVGSTQAVARRHAENGGHVPSLFLADTQSEGVGRLGRSFYSPSDTGIYMTLLVDLTDEDVSDVVRVTSAAAVAVALAVERVTGVECKIKWVNDIYVGGKKACGILTQSFSVGERRYVAIGVGINVSTSVFPPELSDVACSLCEGDNSTRAELTLAVSEALLDICGDLRNTSYMNEYRARSLVLGREVTFTVNGETRTGVAESIDGGGCLTVNVGGEKVTLASGEITLRVNENGGKHL